MQFNWSISPFVAFGFHNSKVFTTLRLVKRKKFPMCSMGLWFHFFFSHLNFWFIWNVSWCKMSCRFNPPPPSCLNSIYWLVSVPTLVWDITSIIYSSPIYIWPIYGFLLPSISLVVYSHTTVNCQALWYILRSSSVGYPSLSFFFRVFLVVSVLLMAVLEFWNWVYIWLNTNEELKYKPVFPHCLWYLFPVPL